MKRAREDERSGVIWLIDGAYVLKGSRDARIDYIRLRRSLQRWAAQGAHFDRCIFFNSAVPGDDKQERFHQWMRDNGFETRLYDLKEMTVECSCCGERFSRQVQKGVDVGLCTAILELADDYHRVVILAGDGDFIDAIRVVKRKFKEVYVCGFQGSMSKEFREEANELKLL